VVAPIAVATPVEAVAAAAKTDSEKEASKDLKIDP